MYQARVRINYPLKQGKMLLRTEQDWNRDVEAETVTHEGMRHEFTISHDRPYMEFKPCIRDGYRFEWSQGTNKLLILTEDEPQDFFPYFFSNTRGMITDLIEIPSAILARNHRFRLYLPAGYMENDVKRYPVLYMHDGINLFFPEEAFLGQEWRVDETLDLLDAMNIIDQTIVVGIYAGDRFQDFTRPGYHDFAKAMVEELKPWVDYHLRSRTEPQNTSVMGSSLGGVISFFTAWEWPQVFGNAACLSSTFSYRDDLIERVRKELRDSRQHSKFYLDSGWPGDNYEATLSMATALMESGFVLGKDVVHYAFPLAAHNEASWAARVHLPIQLFAGKLWRAAQR